MRKHYYYGSGTSKNDQSKSRQAIATMKVQYPVLAQVVAGFAWTLTSWVPYAIVISPHLTLGLREHREAFLMEGSVA